MKQLDNTPNMEKHKTDPISKKNRHHDEFKNEDEQTPEKKKKKSKKSKELLEGTELAETEADSDTKKKKKRKKARNNSSSDHEDTKAIKVKEISNDGNIENGGTKPKKKKKKRDRSESADSTEDIDHNNDTINSKNSSSILKIKNKRKSSEDDGENKDIQNKGTESNTGKASINGNTDDNDVTMESEVKKIEEPIFPILEKQKHQKKSAVRRALPRWLNEPYSVPLQFENNQMSLDDCQSFLSENTIVNLKKMNIADLFPVQSKIVPHVMKMHKICNPCFPKRSVCVQSPTGSGKTLSYVLPIVEILSKNVVQELYCLVIVPSKELAMQVKQVFDHFVVGTNLKVGLFSGAKTVAAEQERVVVKRYVVVVLKLKKQ